MLVLALCLVLLLSSSSLTAKLAFRQQRRLRLDALPFIEKELQQLVQRQATATCKCSGDCAILHVVIRAHTPTTDADIGGCPRRVPQTRAVDVVEEWSQAVVCRSGDQSLTRRRVYFKINKTKGAQRHLHATYSQQRHAHKSNKSNAQS